jgi:hypothetical protein
LRVKLFNKTVLSVLVIMALVLPSMLATAALAAGSYPYTPSSTEVASALNYLRAQQGTDGKISDFATSAWAVMAIAAAGENPHNWKVGSNPSIVDYLSTNAGSASSTTDYSRMILAIAAADEDPSNFGGRNFVSLLEAAYNNNQIGDTALLNDDFWGVMALIAAGKSASDPKVQGSVSFILSNQNADGGWSWGVGQDSDVDDTAAAIMALMAAGQSQSSTPITNALAYIKSTQMNNGGFESWGSTNSATDSWGINGIVAAKQNPTNTDWKSSGGKDPVDDLLTFQNADGSFNWTSAIPSNKALMTSYAITALLGKPWPVKVLQTPATVTVAVRIEGQSSTIWSGNVTVSDSTIVDDQGNSHYLPNPTALGALDEAAKAGNFTYVVKNTAYGLYIYSIAGEEPVGWTGWLYWVDYYSPSVGAADFILGQTTPPTPPHQEVLFAYGDWGENPLKVEVDDTTPNVGQPFTVTVTEYVGSTWSPVGNATVHADQDYTTSQDGTVTITINSDMTVQVYAEKDGYIRSNRVTVIVGTRTIQPPDTATVGMTASIIPAISFSVDPDQIDFGTLGPGDTSDPKTLTLTNLGAWKLKITADVQDTAGDLYKDGLKLDGVKWDAFSTTVDRNGSTDCTAVLIVPETYLRIGKQDGTLIFWATDGRP